MCVFFNSVNTFHSYFSQPFLLLMSTSPILMLQTVRFFSDQDKGNVSLLCHRNTEELRGSYQRSLRETQWFPKTKLSYVLSFVQITKLVNDQEKQHNIKVQGGILTIIQVHSLLLQKEKFQTNCLNQQCLVLSGIQSSVKPIKITYTRASPRNILFLRLFLKNLLRIFGNGL